MNLLFIENNDSFSWNVIDRLPFDRAEISIVPHDDPGEIRRHLRRTSAVVIGPGPLDPLRADLGWIVQEAIEQRLPILGICLGCQAVGLAYGADLIRTRPYHGYVSQAFFTPSRFFPDFQGPVEVMRYHSLCLTRVASPLRVIARTSDGVTMAVEHATLPIAGLQFHPDSFGTPRGEEMLASFFRAIS